MVIGSMSGGRIMRNALTRSQIITTQGNNPLNRVDDTGYRDPWGGSWSITPPDPVSPFDCERYPNSPYCGGSGFQISPAIINVELTGSHQCINVQPSLGFVSLAPTAACRIVEPLNEFQAPEIPFPEGVLPETYPYAAPIGLGTDYDGLGLWSIYEWGFNNPADGTGTSTGYAPGRQLFPPSDPDLWYWPSLTRTNPNNPRGYIDGRDGACDAWRFWNAMGRPLGVGKFKRTYWTEYIRGEYVGNFQQVLVSIWAVGYLSDLTELFLNSGAPQPIPWGLMYACEPRPPRTIPPLRAYPMDCCEAAQDNLELSKRILKAIGEFPTTVPETMVDPATGFFGELFTASSSTQKEIKSLRDLTGWVAETVHEVLGGFHQVVEIQDSSLTEEGDQSEKVVLPNIAETLTELFQMAFQTNRNSQALISLGIRNLMESGLGRKEAIVGRQYSQANAEYLAYKGKEIELSVPFSFSLPSAGDLANNSEELENLAKILQESVIKVKSWEFDDDDRTLQFYLADLLQAAAIIRAVNFQRLNPGGNMTEQILDIYRLYQNFTEEDDVNRTATGDGVTRANSWSAFIEAVERGFVDESGATNTTDPYGRDISQRPRIREIGVTQGDIPGGGSSGSSSSSGQIGG